MQQQRAKINLFIISVIFSFLLFFIPLINTKLYSVVFLLVWIAVILNFALVKNKEFYYSSLIISLANLLVLIIYLFFHQQLNFANMFPLFLNLFFIVCVFTCIRLKSKEKESNKVINSEYLYPQRKEDLKRLAYYLERFNIIGINAPWGEGKSFLFNKLKKNHGDQYEIIEVDILACNFDELRITLINELEALMYKNKVISKYSSRLKKLMSSSNNSMIQFLKAFMLSDVDSFASTINGLKEDLKKLDKNIIINFEDIDRINNRKTIIKIFSLSEKLAADNIKILFQLNEEVLIEEKQFKPIYLEKYLQHKINLTKIDFFDNIDNIYKSSKHDKEIVSKEDFKFLRTRMQNISFIDYFNDFSLNGMLSVEFNNLNIRKLKIFINEVFATVEDENLEVDKKTTIAFFFLKHFYSNKYRELNFKDKLIDVFTFELGDEAFTLKELVIKRKMGEVTEDKLELIFKDDNNRTNLMIFRLFDYNLGYVNVKNDKSNSNSDNSQEALHNFKFKHNNLKKERMINKLYANGRSQFTNYEKAVEIFIDEVLSSSDIKEQKAGYQKFHQILYSNNLIDNRTIFKIGTNNQAELFKAFNIAEKVTESEKIDLIKFYFSQKPDDIIEPYLIDTFNYVLLQSKEEYLTILSYFNNLEIEGNLNRYSSFSTFFKKYLSAISELGFLETTDYFMLHTNKSLTQQFNKEKPVIKELNKIKDSLIEIQNNFKSRSDFNKLVEEYRIIINFVEKIAELISCDKVYKEKKNNKRGKNKTKNQREFIRLKKIGSKQKRISMAKKSYDQGEINAVELGELLD